MGTDRRIPRTPSSPLLLSLQWMRAFGYLVPEEHRDDETKRRVLFLDGRPHSGHETAFLAVAAEKAKSAVIDLADKRK